MQSHGIASRTELLASGVTSNEIQRRVRRGHWRRVRTGIYAIGPVAPEQSSPGAVGPLTWRQRFAAELCWGGEHAVLSHRSAAYVYGFDGFLTLDSGAPDVTVPGNSACRGDRVHRTSHALDRVIVSDLAVVSPEVCLVQLGQVASAHAVEAALESALRHGITTVERVTAVAFGDDGRLEGGKVLRSILQRRPAGATPTANALETAVLQVMRGLGCRDIERRAMLSNHEYAFLVPRRRLAVVCANEPVAANRDVTDAGWTILHFGLGDLAAGPRAMADTVRAAIIRSQRLTARVRAFEARQVALEPADRAA
jgi:hypothetical protein